MLSGLRRSLQVLFISIAVAYSLVPVAAMAQNLAVCDGAQVAGSSLNCKDGSLSDDQFVKVAKFIVNTLSVIVGTISVIMIIIGGFRYVVSGGDGNSVSGAKNTILYAIVGLVVVLFAQVIVRFVLTNTKTK